MSRKKVTVVKKYKYVINALVLILPVIYLYQSLNPVFPPVLETKTLGEYSITPMPYTETAPYQHDGVYVKDFLLMFEEGDVANIRQAYLNIAAQPLPLNKLEHEEMGILHGTPHGQHVHALTSESLRASDKIWLTLQQWDGSVETISWDIPENLLP
ncbi:hypothetical protein [Pseudoalteromonas sp. GB56]